MQNILEVRDLGRSYVNFRLEHISFSIAGGTIMGLVGEIGSAGTSQMSNANRTIPPMTTRISKSLSVRFSLFSLPLRAAFTAS